MPDLRRSTEGTNRIDATRADDTEMQDGPPTVTTAPPKPQVPPPLSLLKSFRPYYSPAELQLLVRLNALASSSSRSAIMNPDTGRKELSEQRVDSVRQLACGFIERVGGRLGFPRRTIATAQTLFHRFHLHYQLKDFPYQDVSVAAILVASKVEDTLKKLRDIQIAAYQITNIMEGGPGVNEGDLAAQEAHRPNLIAIERLILQTICFNFHLHRTLPPTSSPDALAQISALVEASAPQSRDVFTYTVRLCRVLAAPKSFAYLAHLVAIDVHRTMMPLAFPPHTCAVACIYLASFLDRRHLNARSWLGMEDKGDPAIASAPELDAGWIQQFESREDDVQVIALALLDLFLLLCPPTPDATATLSGPSPTFSPLSTLASPIDPSAAIAPPPSAASKTSEREKHLLQTGVPHTIAMGWGGYIVDATPVTIASTTTTAAEATGADASNSIFAVRVLEDFTKIKIRLRELGSTTVPPPQTNGNKRPLSGENGHASTPLKRARPPLAQADSQRWAGAAAGLLEIEERRQEIEEREAEKAALKEDREKGTSLQQEGVSSSTAIRPGPKLKPSSIRYRF